MARKRHLMSVLLDELDWQDQSFAIHSFTRNDFLQRSLTRHGVICPPWLLQKDRGPPIIVDGFKRFKWLKDAGATQVECLVFEASNDVRDLMIQRLEAKICGTNLNIAEKAQIIARLTEIVPHQQLIAEYLPAMNLPPRPQAIDRWTRVAAAETLLLSALANDRLCERAGLELIDWSAPERQKTIALFCELRCSTSIQMEILERITEIAAVQEKTRMDLIATQEIQDILNDADRNHRQKTQDLRALLHLWRFPRLSARQKGFQRDLDEIGLPQAVRLQPPPAFEGDSWQLQIQFSSRHELQESLTSAQALASSQKFPELLGWLNPSTGTVPTKDTKKS